MTDLILPRRKFLTGLAALIAAPAVVRAASLMPVKKLPRAVFFHPGLMTPYDNAAFVEGLSQRIMQTVWYGNPETSPSNFAGLCVFVDQDHGLQAKIVRDYEMYEGAYA